MGTREVAASKYAIYDLVKKFHLNGIVKDLPLHGCHMHGSPCMAIPHVTQDVYHAIRKHGPHKHTMGMHCSFLVAPHVDTHLKMKL